jgi:hypothetical protein
MSINMPIRMLGLAIVTAALLPELAAAQSPPSSKTPNPPAAAPAQSRDCAPTTPSTTGQGGDAHVAKPDGSDLSQKLAQSNGVLCPPDEGDPAMRAPTPPDSGSMRVIPPPGTPGGPNQSVQPK